MRLVSTLLLLLLVNSALFGQQEQPVTPRIGVKIPLGKEVQIKGYSFTFMEVIQDSRCPLKVDCIWAGKAEVSVAVRPPDGMEITKEISFEGGEQAANNTRLLIEGERWNFYGLSLLPYPEEPGEEMEYVLLVASEPKN